MSSKSIKRSLMIIEWLAIQTETVSFTEIVSALSLPKSSAFDLLKTLVELEYIVRDRSGRYRLIRLPGELGAKGHRLGVAVRIIEPLILDLVEKTGESVYLAELTEDTHIKYFKSYLPNREICYDRNISDLRVAHEVSSGLILLAGLNAEDLAIYAEKEEIRLNKPGLKETIIERVRQVAVEGIAVNLEGFVEGASGMAAPVTDSGSYIMAINVAGIKERFVNNLDSIKEELLHTITLCSEKISPLLGGK